MLKKVLITGAKVVGVGAGIVKGIGEYIYEEATGREYLTKEYRLKDPVEHWKGEVVDY